MFSKPERPGHTVIGAGTVFEGTLRVAGTIQVDGTVRGDLLADGHVDVGPKGIVEGQVSGDSVAIGGRVEGRVTARTVLHMVKTGLVKGDVHYGSLQVDRGANIEGTLQGQARTAERPAEGSVTESVVAA
jgi:cytoskeletal protein CcmA (bactofilin family)